MGVFASWDVTCNACGAQTGISAVDPMEASEQAQQRGWFVSPDLGSALCPDCDGENE